MQQIESTNLQRTASINEMNNTNVTSNYNSKQQNSDAKTNKQDICWEGKCIHIVIELAECGDVQMVSKETPLKEVADWVYVFSCSKVSLKSDFIFRKEIYGVSHGKYALACCTYTLEE